jgi:hypothetical protein
MQFQNSHEYQPFFQSKIDCGILKQWRIDVQVQLKKGVEIWPRYAHGRVGNSELGKVFYFYTRVLEITAKSWKEMTFLRWITYEQTSEITSQNMLKRQKGLYQGNLNYGHNLIVTNLNSFFSRFSIFWNIISEVCSYVINVGRSFPSNSLPLFSKMNRTSQGFSGRS